MHVDHLMSRRHRSTLGFGHFAKPSVKEFRLISIKSIAWTAAAEPATQCHASVPKVTKRITPLARLLGKAETAKLGHFPDCTTWYFYLKQINNVSC